MNALQVVSSHAVLTALLNHDRLELLDYLREPHSASSLARLTNKPRQQINYHLRELERLGLLKHVEDRKRGNCIERILLRTVDTVAISPDVLGKLSPAPERESDRLSAAYLIATAAKLMRDLGRVLSRATAQQKKVATLTMTSDVRFASADTRAQFAREVADALASISAKYHDESAPRGRTFTWMFGAYPTVTHENEGE